MFRIHSSLRRLCVAGVVSALIPAGVTLAGDGTSAWDANEPQKKVMDKKELAKKELDRKDSDKKHLAREPVKKEDVKKPGDKKGGDVEARLATLERQVHELATMIKSQMHGVKKPDGDGAGPSKLAVFKKPSAAPHEKSAKGKETTGTSSIRLVKGPDGELMVPLSALPKDLQEKFVQASNAKKGPGKPDGKPDTKHAPDLKKDGKEGDHPKKSQGKKEKDDDDD